MSDLERHLTAQSESFSRFFWHRLRWKAVSEYFPTDRTFDVLDIGAGAGHFGTFLAERFPRARYHFVEPIPALERRLVDRFGADRNAVDLVDLPTMEFVTLLDVLEHQADDTAFLRDLLRRCRPGTTIILTVPALESLWSNWDVALGHHRRYDRQMLTDVVAPLPVHVLEVSYLFPELVLPGRWRARRSRRRQPIGDADETSFPDLPDAVNDTLYRLGSPGITYRRHLPTGSSLIAAMRLDATHRTDGPEEKP